MGCPLVGGPPVYGFCPFCCNDGGRFDVVSFADFSTMLGLVWVDCKRDVERYDVVDSVSEFGVGPYAVAESSFVVLARDPYCSFIAVHFEYVVSVS